MAVEIGYTYGNVGDRKSGKSRYGAVAPKTRSLLDRATELANQSLLSGKRIGRIEVFSGGQPAGQKVLGTKVRKAIVPGVGGGFGSPRHDFGGAADVHVYDQNGNRVDYSTTAGKNIFNALARSAAQVGATGIGFGTGYMGNATIHIGFGGQATWGGMPSDMKRAVQFGWDNRLPDAISWNPRDEAAAQISRLGYVDAQGKPDVAAFQRAVGAPVDGVLGPVTMTHAWTASVDATGKQVVSLAKAISPGTNDPLPSYADAKTAREAALAGTIVGNNPSVNIAVSELTGQPRTSSLFGGNPFDIAKAPSPGLIGRRPDFDSVVGPANAPVQMAEALRRPAVDTTGINLYRPNTSPRPVAAQPMAASSPSRAPGAVLQRAVADAAARRASSPARGAQAASGLQSYAPKAALKTATLAAAARHAASPSRGAQAASGLQGFKTAPTATVTPRPQAPSAQYKPSPAQAARAASSLGVTPSPAMGARGASELQGYTPSIGSVSLDDSVLAASMTPTNVPLTGTVPAVAPMPVPAQMPQVLPPLPPALTVTKPTVFNPYAAPVPMGGVHALAQRQNLSNIKTGTAPVSGINYATGTTKGGDNVLTYTNSKGKTITTPASGGSRRGHLKKITRISRSTGGTVF
jgi:hypothetical protein